MLNPSLTYKEMNQKYINLYNIKLNQRNHQSEIFKHKF